MGIDFFTTKLNISINSGYFGIPPTPSHSRSTPTTSCPVYFGPIFFILLLLGYTHPSLCPHLPQTWPIPQPNLTLTLSLFPVLFLPMLSSVPGALYLVVRYCFLFFYFFLTCVLCFVPANAPLSPGRKLLPKPTLVRTYSPWLLDCTIQPS